MIAPSSADGPIPAIDLGTHVVIDPSDPPDGTLSPDLTTYPPFCGDGVADDVEECDDANPISSDACTNECRVASCGDSSVWAGHEVADPGVQLVNDGCGVPCNDPHSGFAQMFLFTAGEDFNCVLKINGAARCWGANDKGKLGLCNSEIVGDDAGEMSTSPWVSLDPAANATFLMTGDHHSCAVLDTGTVKCWGEHDCVRSSARLCGAEYS